MRMNRLNILTLLFVLFTGHISNAAQAIRLDQPPTATQKPHYPDGQTVEVSPPPFIWVPAGKGLTYSLQVSTREDFRTDSTRTFAGLKHSVHALREPLPAGKWFWRYGVEADGTLTWSRPRTFNIAENARPFPFPDFDQVAMKVPASRPRLFFPPDQLARIRAAARGELKDAVARLVADCQKAIDEPLVPEPGYEPKDPAERGPWAIRIMGTTRPPMDMMERCALAYLITGERRLGLEAKRRLLYFFSWDPEGPTSFFAYDEPPMWVMMRGTRAYDWTYDLFTAEERAKIEPNMKARALQFLKRLQSMPFESSPFESHAGRLPGFLGECAISFIHEWPEAKEWLRYVTLLYYTSYPAWGGDDGGWQEGPHYWSAYMGFAVHYVTALRVATGIDLMQKPFLRNTPYYALYTATPYQEHAPFGDGQDRRPSGLGPVMYAFSTLTQNPYFRWHAEALGYRPGADVLSLSNYDPDLRARTPVDLPQARLFGGVGLVSLHTALGDPERDIAFLLRSSPYGSVSHGHADQNAFTISAFGRDLAIATGYYPWYGSPHHHDWTRATRAVNSILVDNEGQVRRSYQATGRIMSLQSSGDYDYVEAEAAKAYGGRLKRFTRHIVQVRPRSGDQAGIFVMYDELEAVKPSTFQWLLHSFDQMQFEGSGPIRVARKPAAMTVHMLLPKDVRLSQTDRYEPEPELARGKMTNTWHLTASTPETATSGRFLTVFVVERDEVGGRAPISIDMVDGAGAVGVRIGRGPDQPVDLVAFRTNAGSGDMTCGGMRSDARVLAARLDAAGRPLLVGGGKLEKVNRP